MNWHGMPRWAKGVIIMLGSDDLCPFIAVC